jgi:predicted secreted Zn-dependent protease
MGTGESLPGNEAALAWSSQLTSMRKFEKEHSDISTSPLRFIEWHLMNHRETSLYSYINDA